VEVLHERVAGLDVHRDPVAAGVRLPGRGQPEVHKHRFPTTTAGVAQLGDWLTGWAVTVVSMEATGVYWKPVYYGLEDRFELWLCNAQHVKNVPGRKTDMSDAEWLADVVAHGMVRRSFVPPPEIRQLRELTRYRRTQIEARIREFERLEKLLQDASIKVSSVASSVKTQSVRAMVEALIDGHRDPEMLAGLAKGKMRSKIDALAQALAGNFDAHHAVAARQILDHIDFVTASITALDTEIAARLRPYQAVVDLLVDSPGLGQRSIEVIVAETGADMTRFPSAARLASWAGVCPANHESAGRRRHGGTPPGNRWLVTTLVEAARAAARTKDSYFRAQYRQIARRRGPNKAAVAVAHSLLVTIWHILTTGERYQDLGEDYFRSHIDPDRQRRRLVHQLQALGYTVTLQTAS
jgi:transposase